MWGWRYWHKDDSDNVSAQHPTPKPSTHVLEPYRANEDCEPCHEPFACCMVSKLESSIRVDVPQAVKAPPICLYSRGAISLQYNQTHPCHAYPKTNRKTKLILMLAQDIDSVWGTSWRVMNMSMRTDMVIAPYIKTDLRPTRSIVK